MSLLIVSISYRSAPIAVLERAVVPAADTGKVHGELPGREHEHYSKPQMIEKKNNPRAAS